MIRRPPRSTQSRSSAASDVYKRQVRDRALARGPGCLGQALGLNREHDGVDLLGSDHLSLRAGEPIERERIASGPRVGVSLAHDVPWRFWVAGAATVSSYKRRPRAA